MLLVLNYHRVGNPDDRFDPGIFSATGDQLDAQISYLKGCVSLVTLQEAQAFVDGTLREKTPRCRVLITFDDGYVDNYDVAFPILRSHGVQGVFFLVTSLVGSCYVPWWDHIAYLMKTARHRRFSLRYPADLVVNVDTNGMTKSLRDVLTLYKRPENTDPARFMQELTEEAEGTDPPGTLRRFLSWDEARDMIAGGMAIGSHTHSHTVLSQLTPEQQRHDLAQSRRLLREQLGAEGNFARGLRSGNNIASPASWQPLLPHGAGISRPITPRESTDRCLNLKARPALVVDADSLDVVGSRHSRQIRSAVK
jgi:peptidoglycan/xylan/chitin deacetylase (PgdA/CDA1 family)